MSSARRAVSAAALAIGFGLSTLAATAPDASAQPLALAPPSQIPAPFDRMPADRGFGSAPQFDARTAAPTSLPSHLRRQIVRYDTREAPGTIIVDTPSTYLYYVLGNGRAVRYGIGVGREGFAFSGVTQVARMAKWPDWIPPAQMLERQPYLPRFMAGGPGNPLGARALYLGDSLYRIHGTNQPESIGQRVSSGCIRMLNEDVVDLYDRVRPGARVVVIPDRSRSAERPATRGENRPLSMSSATRSRIN